MSCHYKKVVYVFVGSSAYEENLRALLSRNNLNNLPNSLVEKHSPSLFSRWYLDTLIKKNEPKGTVNAPNGYDAALFCTQFVLNS